MNRRVTSPAWPGGAALALALSLAFLLCVFPAISFDVWWHLRTGRLIVETGRIPHVDPYTYTAAGRPWVTHEWLAEVVFYLLHRIGGIDLLILFKAALAAATLAASAWAGLKARGSPARRGLPAAAIGVLVAAPLISPRAFIRPHMFTALLLGSTLLLLRFRTATGREGYRRALIPLFILWANLHSGFVLGLGLVLLYWCGEMLESRTARSRPPLSWTRPAVYFLILTAATLINPNFYHALLYPFRLMTVPGALAGIAELRSIFDPAYRGALFLDAMVVACILLAILFVRDLIRARSRARWSLLLPAVFFLLLALHSLRGVSEFAVLLPAAIGAQGAIFMSRRRTAAIASAAVALLALAGGAAALRWGQPMGADPSRRAGLGVDPVNCPELSARFLRKEAPHGRIFNVLPFGGYLIYELWPGWSVYIDGRLDLFPRGFLTSYLSLLSTGKGWDETVSRYGISFAVVDYSELAAEGQGLYARLGRDPAWVCVCFGDDFVIYARRTEANQALIERFGSPFDPSEHSEVSIDKYLAKASAEDRDRAISALRNIAAFAPDEKAPSLALGLFLDRAGRHDEAIAPLRNAVRLDPTLLETRVSLARALVGAGSDEEARRELAAVLGSGPKDVDALIKLSEMERSAGRLEASAGALREATAREPKSYLAHLRLGIAEAELGRYAEAQQSFRRALEIKPNDPSTLKNMEILETLAKSGRPSEPSTSPRSSSPR